MTQQLRGYQPRTRRFVTAVAPTAAEAEVRPPNEQVTAWLQIRNTSAVAGQNVRVYWSEADFTADANFVTILPGAELEGPAEVKELWLRSEVGAPVAEIIFYVRRG